MALDLPRRQDVSSQILTKIDEATNSTLNPALANSWLNELDESILATKQQIHDRINQDLPLFQQQLASSKSVQTRLHDLTVNVDALHDKLSNPKTGLIPVLSEARASHDALTRQTAEATTLFQLLSHLQRSYTAFQRVSSLAEQGSLADATQLSHPLQALLDESPPELNDAAVMKDLKRTFAATRARIEEQLTRACTECMTVTSTNITIHGSTKIPPTETVLPLAAVLSSLSQAALTIQLNILRRDLTTRVFDTILGQPTTVSCSENQIRFKPSFLPAEILSGRLENLGQVLTFLSEHLFSNLPPSETGYPQSLCRFISTGLLDRLITPSLPDSFAELPPFLELLHHAVLFEEQYIIGLLGDDPHDRPIQTWANGVGGHYERHRRSLILEAARLLFTTPDDKSKTFVVHVELPVSDVQPAEEEMKDETQLADSSPAVVGPADDAWGFDDMADDKPAEPHPGSEDPPLTAESDAWGFDDEEPTPDEPETDAWDEDPWADVSSESLSKQVQPTSSPKVATRLEKLANKGKKHLNGSSPMHSPLVPSPLSPHANSIKSPSQSLPPVVKPPDLAAARALPKETYIVSSRMKEVLKMVEEVLNECLEYSDSPPANQSGFTSSPPGTTIAQSAASLLDLYRALSPVVFKAQLDSTLDGAIRLANNYVYLSSELEWLEGRSSLADERLADCRNTFKILSDSWLDDAIKKQCRSVVKILVDGADGFQSTSIQDRYDACEEAVNGVLQTIRRVGQSWKGLLTKSKYYTALGTIVESALTKILGDVLALPDITAVESQRLSETCKILRALEGLFVEDTTQDSFVAAYAPSWLKYSYLYELLEATMADITYLFEEGLLVDFETDELVRLVRALFADTALRTNLINKLTTGHGSVEPQSPFH